MTTTASHLATMPGSRLDQVRDVADLRKLPAEALPALAAEIRDTLISTVTRTGGHLGPNLGVVELTIALHRVFSSPQDAILFDTGHQSYVHKLLTGRRQEFDLLRQPGGLSGYPSRVESPHDFVENSHASTALSYADGLARAFALTPGPRRHVVAVVGDGALTGGMCWEALNNLAVSERPVVIVLNDNGRSYAPTVGAIGRHLGELRGDTGKFRLSLFENLGITYIGPVDGHDLDELDRALRKARALCRPVVVHCVTSKGKGHTPAETDEADRLHTVPPAPSASPAITTTPRPGWTSVFAEEIVELGKRRPDLTCLTAAMLRPTGLHRFAEEFPDRTHDVGIAEQHAVTFAAGLATEGYKPFCAIYSTFLQRGYDQVVHDVALQKLPVRFALDRAGLVGADGATHAGAYDVAYLGCLPDMAIMAAADEAELVHMVATAAAYDAGPIAFRFPRGEGVGVEMPEKGIPLTIGKGRIVREGSRVALLSFGTRLAEALKAAEELEARGLSTTVADARFAKPLDEDLVLRLAREHEVLLTIEEGSIGGFGSFVLQLLAERGMLDRGLKVRSLVLPDLFIDHDKPERMYAGAGLDATGIVTRVFEVLGRERGVIKARA
jgi:1-deoxy-D-xylulose-5-phosphate synthase